MLISLRQLLDHAAEHDYGIPAFNINNLEQILAVMAAADATSSPVIVQTSTGSRDYAGEDYLMAMISTAIARYPHIPVVCHRDHAQTPALCLASIQAGFSSLMMDGSLMPDAKTPSSWDYNVAVTQKVVDMAHMVGVSVEGELGCLGNLERGDAGKEDGVGAEGHLTREMLLTDPEEAKRFVALTQVDALAIAIGTSHGAYKFDRAPTADLLAIDRVAEIHRQIPNTHLVMHGSSSVPQNYLEDIRRYGGEMPETYGVPVDNIVQAIRHGVRKINIDTDIRLAMTAAVRRYLVDNPSAFDPRSYLRAAREAATQVCIARYEAFGSAGQAEKITCRSLGYMASWYAQRSS